jgi:uncharacterized protein DUF4288
MPSQRKRPTSRLAWYGVKTIFRTAAAGAPVAKDASYDPSVTLVEERVILLKARTHAHAIRQAEREARAYAADRHVNPYGQRVITRYLGACDVMELFSPPGVGSEVFSTTEVVHRRVTDKSVVNQRLGHVESEREGRTRRNILNREFAGEAKHGV